MGFLGELLNCGWQAASCSSPTTVAQASPTWRLAHQPRTRKTSAAKLQLLHKVVPRGLEPRTLRLLAVRSNQLSYETDAKGIAIMRHLQFRHKSWGFGLSAFLIAFS